MGLKFKLAEILEEMDIAKNRLAVEGKIRPATVAKYAEGKMGRIEVATLVSILDTLNTLAPIVEKESKEDPKKKPYTAKTYSLEDLIEYKYEGASS
ncbi:helix-turn-helix domain-containing protein [[Bacillus] enclensis]|uniref:helix-turn-helix domain-containing protein n=1 Tax=[Bacillus] enclensis TaxID=1402860 RepID=UPI0018DBA519|nr:helix-turn-helix domain-containing protein [[Bacillus] enclensis]MBH9965596.1 XRE family transcriptional regulator [[Bacillus] enclensis]